MTMLGLLGAAVGGVGSGMQRRRQEQATVDLRMLDQQLTMELQNQQRKWAQADLQEERSYKEGQLEKVSAGLPPGMLAVPSGVKIADTRRKATGGGGSSAPGKLTAIQKEQIKALKDIRDKAYERYQDETASPEARSLALQEYQNADNQFKSMIGLGQTQQAGTGQPASDLNVESFLGGFGLPKKGEAKEAAATEPAKPAQRKTRGQLKREQRSTTPEQIKAQEDASAVASVDRAIASYKKAMASGRIRDKTNARNRLKALKRSVSPEQADRIDQAMKGK